MSESELRVLECLARYKYLTVSQLDALAILKHKNGLYERLRKLQGTGKPFIKKNVFGVYPGQGRLEDFYYLTPKGGNFLADNLELDHDEIKLPIGTSSLFSRDYFHRYETINFYIYLDKWAEANNADVTMFNYYFDKVGNNRKGKNLRALNRIEIDQTGGYIIPDAITKFYYNNQPYLFFVEQHNGKDTKKLLKQLYYHLLALEEGKGAERYKLEKNHRVAVVFEFQGILEATIERLQDIQEFKGFEKFFIFKTNADLKEDFYNDWLTFDNRKVGFV